jgi:hypothetical protein
VPIKTNADSRVYMLALPPDRYDVTCFPRIILRVTTCQIDGMDKQENRESMLQHRQAPSRSALRSLGSGHHKQYPTRTEGEEQVRDDRRLRVTTERSQCFSMQGCPVSHATSMQVHHPSARCRPSPPVPHHSPALTPLPVSFSSSSNNPSLYSTHCL